MSEMKSNTHICYKVKPVSEMKSHTYICYKVKQCSIFEFVTPASRYWSPTRRAQSAGSPSHSDTRLLSWTGHHQVRLPTSEWHSRKQTPSCWAILSSFMSVISKDKEL